MALPPFYLPGTLPLPAVAQRLRISEAGVRAKIRGSLKAFHHNSELVVAEADLAAYQRQNGEAR